MSIRNTFVGLLALGASTIVVAEKKEVVLNPQHPDQYTVATGDTLWDVAGKFLRDPAQWPELWDSGGKTEHPLRPGDVLTLTQEDGKPRLKLNSGDVPVHRSGDPLPVVKLSPSVRITDAAAEIPVIPMSSIRSFLTSPRIVTEDELEEAPYVVETPDRRRFTGSGHKLYVRGAGEDEARAAYGVFHKGKALFDGESGEELGFEAVHVGDASLTQPGDPAIFTLVNSLREAMEGDRLLPLVEERLPSRYEPHAPDFDLHGRIIGFMGTESIGGRNSSGVGVGQFSVVVLDRGSNEGLEPGHVLAIYHKGHTVDDKRSGRFYDSVAMPDEDVGRLMVFRVFERASYGLVMMARQDLHPGDVVQTP